jgi:hypothetical protein
MSDDNEKKDITRIEDLSEFLHEEEQIDEDTQKFFEEQASLPEIPDVAQEGEELSFDSEETSFDSEDPQESDFGNDEEVSFDSEESSFGSDEEEASFDSEESSFGSDEEEVSFDTGESDFDATEESSNEPSQEAQERQEVEAEPIEEPVEEVKPEPVAPAAVQETKPVEVVKPKPTQAQETFKDVISFVENMSFGSLSHEGNPPYSIVIKNIKYKEDIEAIIELLAKHELAQDVDSLRDSLSRGSYLISRLSEFAAIFLAHKLRVFDVDLLIGLSEEIHRSESYSNEEDRGMVSERSLHQNSTDEIDMNEHNKSFEDVIISTEPEISWKKLIAHQGIISEFSIVKASIVEHHESITPLDEEFDPASLLVDSFNDDYELSQVYKQLIERIKVQAQAKTANAVVNVKFDLKALADDAEKYQIMITGDAVYLVDSNELEKSE